MGTKEETAAKLFADGYNCAQAVLGAFCEEAGLDCNTALKLTNGFGGGVRCGEICGAVSGAVMVIGLKHGFFVEKDFQQKGYCNQKAFAFLEAFQKANGSVLCRDLLGLEIYCPEDHTTSVAQAAHQSRCPAFVVSAVKLLEAME